MTGLSANLHSMQHGFTITPDIPIVDLIGIDINLSTTYPSFNPLNSIPPPRETHPLPSDTLASSTTVSCLVVAYSTICGSVPTVFRANLRQQFVRLKKRRSVRVTNQCRCSVERWVISWSEWSVCRLWRYEVLAVGFWFCAVAEFVSGVNVSKSCQKGTMVVK